VRAAAKVVGWSIESSSPILFIIDAMERMDEMDIKDLTSAFLSA